MGEEELVLRFDSQPLLAEEYGKNLSEGRAFVSGATHLPLFSRCTLVLEHTPTHTCLEIAAEVVMVMSEGELHGSALQFLDRSREAREALEHFVHHVDDSPMVSLPPLDPLQDEQADDEDAQSRDPIRMSLSQQRQQKLRDLPVAERMKVARGPSLEDRTLLERIYGNAVWDALLRNPKITVPEVARLARKGTMPRTLLDLIVENDNWIRQGIVRRSLLSNPRLSPEGVAKVLRTMSGRELKLIPQQTAYPPQVRAVAQRLMRGG